MLLVCGPHTSSLKHLRGTRGDPGQGATPPESDGPPFFSSRWWDSNPRPDDYKSPALPAAPHRRGARLRDRRAGPGAAPVGSAVLACRRPQGQAERMTGPVPPLDQAGTPDEPPPGRDRVSLGRAVVLLAAGVVVGVILLQVGSRAPLGVGAPSTTTSTTGAATTTTTTAPLDKAGVKVLVANGTTTTNAAALLLPEAHRLGLADPAGGRHHQQVADLDRLLRHRPAGGGGRHRRRPRAQVDGRPAAHHLGAGAGTTG